MSCGSSTGSMPGSGSSGASADILGVTGTGATPSGGGEGRGEGGTDGLDDGVLSTEDSLQLDARARTTTRKHNVHHREGVKSMLAYLLVEEKVDIILCSIRASV